jgi:hypothetical protein
VPDDFEPAGQIIEGLSHLVADLAQRAAATGTGARCGMPQILSGQVFRQWAPRRLLHCGLDYRGDCRRCRCQPLRLVDFQRLERQLELRMHPLALAESGWVWVGAGSRPAGLRTGRAIPGLRRDAALPVRQNTRQGREGGALLSPNVNQ